MAEKKMHDLPPSFSNLAYDSEPAAAPSAPRFNTGSEVGGAVPEFAAQSSAPTFEPEPFSTPLTYNPPNLVFENVYEACVRYADKHCCYGKRFLNQMKLQDIINKVVFYYKLESFGEKRESRTKSKPYKGELVDGPHNGQPPDPWVMTVLPRELFKDHDVTVKVPHTEIAVICSNCGGRGNITCSSCGGNGNKQCRSCSGTGTQLLVFKCSDCNGSGKKLCWSCVGVGSDPCPACADNKSIKTWKELSVTWKNHESEFFTDAGNLPNEKIRKAKGVELIKIKDNYVLPVTNAPDVTVNTASARLLETHKNSFNLEMIIRQRHILRAVPLTRVTYQWKQSDGEFYVYDTDQKVYFEDYPQSCCCCTCS